MPEEYWNHNSAYHPWILRQIAGRAGLVALDVGCGEGLLLQRLAPQCATLVGIDPDPVSIKRAAARGLDATLAPVLFDDFTSEHQFDLITMVATLHHMELEPTLLKAKELLKPGGQLLVVGLAARKSVVDWLYTVGIVPIALVGSAVHRETRDIGVRIAQPGLVWLRCGNVLEGCCLVPRFAGVCITGFCCRGLPWVKD